LTCWSVGSNSLISYKGSKHRREYGKVKPFSKRGKIYKRSGLCLIESPLSFIYGLLSIIFLSHFSGILNILNTFCLTKPDNTTN
jgi:hypothetical protein